MQNHCLYSFFMFWLVWFASIQHETLASTKQSKHSKEAQLSPLAFATNIHPPFRASVHTIKWTLWTVNDQTLHVVYEKSTFDTQDNFPVKPQWGNLLVCVSGCLFLKLGCWTVKRNDMSLRRKENYSGLLKNKAKRRLMLDLRLKYLRGKHSVSFVHTTKTICGLANKSKETFQSFQWSRNF